MSHILVIDDDPALRGLIEIMLTRAGHLVSCAENGLEGLDACRRENPDAVLTDMVMPELDGIGFIQAARAEFPDLPIVAMSGGVPESGGYLQAARIAGACGILPKPFAIGELTGAIGMALSAREVPSGAVGESATPFASCALA